VTPTSGSAGWAVDTSVAIAALDESHDAHTQCRSIAIQRRPALAGHAAFETYSVLTRLPGAQRVDPEIVGDLMRRAFPTRCWLAASDQGALLERLPELGLVGGTIYDALVGEASRLARRTLLTRDGRARRTYELLGVDYAMVD